MKRAEPATRAGAALLALFLAVLAAPSATLAMDRAKEPKGFEGAQFGTSVEQLQKLHPGVQELKQGEKLAAAAVYTPNIRRFVLRGQKLAGSEVPATVELRFWKDELWMYLTYFEAADKERVVAWLEKQFGPPDHNQAERPLWAGDRILIIGELERGYITVQDEIISRKAQTWFGEAAAAGHREQHLPLKAVTPAAAPAGGSTTPAASPPP